MNDQKLYPVLKDSGRKERSTAASSAVDESWNILTDLFAAEHGRPRRERLFAAHALKCSDFVAAIATSAFLRPQSGESLPSVSLKTKKK